MGRLGHPGHRHRSGGRGGAGLARRGILPGRLVRDRAGGACAGDGGGDPAAPVGDHAGDRDPRVRGFVPGDRAGRRDADLAASAGRVIRQGQALYKTGNGSPVVLLYGSVPDWRNLVEGVTGADVSQLNHDLVDLGCAGRADIAVLGWDYYSWETTYGVQRLEERLGVSYPPGSLSLGQVVFEPQALRVSRVTGSLGGPASGPVLAATSDRHVVTIPLDAADQSEVK